MNPITLSRDARETFTIKSAEEIACMRRSGAALARTLRTLQEAILNGERSSLALDDLARDTLASLGATASFKDYVPPFAPKQIYPYHLCVSINNEIVHGLPCVDKVLRDGDLVTLDLGACIDGWHADSAISMAVGTTPTNVHNLLLATKKALKEGIKAARNGLTTGDIGHAIEESLKHSRYHPAKNLTGHGIGRILHEPPNVPNEGLAGSGTRLVAGMVICIEPMVCEGSGEITGDITDPWTVYTADGGLAAHMEHTVVITLTGAEILTKE